MAPAIENSDTGTVSSVTASQSLVSVALAQLNVDIRRRYENANIYTAWANCDGSAWCVIFCSYCMTEAGVSWPWQTWGQGQGSSYPANLEINVGTVGNKAQSNGIYVSPDDLQPGDLIIFGDQEHIGIVVEGKGRSCTTVEGNTSSDIVKKNSASGRSVWGGIRFSGTVNPSSTSLYSTSSFSDEYDPRAIYANTVPYTPSEIRNRRLSSLVKHPLKAYCQIWLGDKLLDTDNHKPSYLQSFSIDRLDGTTGAKLTFTIFDQNWEEIEYFLSEYWNNVKVQYGYVDSKLVSPIYECMLTNYSISFNSRGVILDVQALSLGTASKISSDNTFRQMTVTTNSTNPTEAAKIICRAAGYEVLDENFDVTLDAGEEFNMVNDIAAAYINDVILSSAISPDGESFNFNIVNNVAYFKAESFTPPANTVDAPMGDIDVSGKVILKTYVYMKGQDSVVEDLSFDINGIFGGTTMTRLASGATAIVIDPLTKEIDEVTETLVNAAEDTIVTGEYQSILTDQSIVNVNSAGANLEETSIELRSSIVRDLTEMYKANMTIIGDPTINMLDNVRIINLTETGNLHHTSGIYMVKSIIDSIDGGVLRTSLQLVRNGNINEGVVLINPRAVVE